mgnify:FL=1
MEAEKLENLAKLKFDENLAKDILDILKWIEILNEVPEFEPLYSPIGEFSTLREDEPERWDFGDVLDCAPNRLGKFIRFLSPIGRKT